MRSSLPIIGLFLLFCGCGDPAGTKSPSPAPVTETANDSSSDVKITLPDIQSGTTHGLRAEGTCNLSVHDRQKPLEFEMQGRMSYRVRISQGPMSEEHWHINPLVDVTNESGSRLYVGYYAAFFNKTGRLVGGCGQQVEAKPSTTPHQLGSLVIYGPKEKLLTATRFKIVIYESDKRIGTEPISADSTQTLVGRSGKVICKLEQIDSSITPSEDHQELRLQANLAFEDPAEKNRNTHLQIEGAPNYDLYLSTRAAPHVMNTFDNDGQKLKESESFNAWETEVEFEQRIRTKGASTIVHAALLDESGRLIACTSTNHNRRLVAPEDSLLSANQLDLIVYASGGSIPSPAKKVAAIPPREMAAPNSRKPDVPASTARMPPAKEPTESKAKEDTPPTHAVPEIDRRDERGFTQLHLAAMAGKVDAAMKLIADGANVNVPQQKYLGTPLQYAAAAGHVDVIKLLLKAGATIDSKDSARRTPLFWAVTKDQPSAAALLLEAGGDPFDHAARSVVDPLKASEIKELFKTFDDYFASQSPAKALRWQVVSLTFTVQRGGETLPLLHASKPALRYPANATSDSLRGRLDFWTSDQIPFAVSSIQIQKNGKLFRSLALLREASVKAVSADKTIWQPASRDHSWRPVPNTEPVSGTSEERTQQMTEIAQRFSMAERTLRPNPVLRYENDLDGFQVADGGVFAFLKNDTPHALLIVEAYGDKPQWRYTLARMTAPPASIQLDGQTVFEWPGYWASPRDAGDDFIEQPIERRR